MRRIYKIVLYIIGFHVVAFVLTMCTFSHYTDRSYQRAQKERPYDVIIVPGVPYDTVDIGKVLKARILWAKFLYDSGFTKNIIFSGSAVYSPYIEGRVMKTIADSLGIPSPCTFAETRAEHSTENIYYSWKMAKSMGFQKIALATDPFQSFMLRSFVKKYCPGVKSIPIIFDKIDTDKPFPHINPSGTYVIDFVSITERESFWTRFQGTRGKRVVEELEKETQPATPSGN